MVTDNTTYALISGTDGYYVVRVDRKHDRGGQPVFDGRLPVYQEAPGAQRVNLDARLQTLLDEDPDADRGSPATMDDGQEVFKLLSLESLRRLLRDLSVYLALGVTPAAIIEAQYNADHEDVPDWLARITGKPVVKYGPEPEVIDGDNGEDVHVTHTCYAMPDGTDKAVRRRRKQR